VELDLATARTNIIICHLRSMSAADIVTQARAKGILSSALGPCSVRLVTHNDVSAADCARAAENPANLI
jgi:threonine aldolase